MTNAKLSELIANLVKVQAINDSLEHEHLASRSSIDLCTVQITLEKALNRVEDFLLTLLLEEAKERKIPADELIIYMNEMGLSIDETYRGGTL